MPNPDAPADRQAAQPASIEAVEFQMQFSLPVRPTEQQQGHLSSQAEPAYPLPNYQ